MSTVERITPVPTVAWKKTTPVDVIHGIEQLRPVQRCGRIINLPGESDKTFLHWAGIELALAQKGGADSNRHLFHVVSHSKRALDRLFDLFLLRDFLHLRLRDRGGFKEKAELLQKRMPDELPDRLVRDIVGAPRDAAEHRYVLPTLDEAVKAVQAARTIAAAMRSHANPENGPALGGILLGSAGANITFDGFHGPFFWMWQGQDGLARIGVGIVANKENAEVAYCEVREMSLDEHLSVLKWWDADKSGLYINESMIRQQFMLANLDGPK